MAEFIILAVSILAFLIGVLFGEALTFRAFGRPKRSVVIIDVLLFVLLVAGIYSYIDFFTVDAYFYAVNFFIGLIVIVLIRSIEAAVGATEKARSSEDIAQRLIPVLVKAGMDADEVKEALRGIGVSAKNVEKIAPKIYKGIPPYLPKVVKIYDEIDEVKAELAKLAAALERRGPQKLRKAAAEVRKEVEESRDEVEAAEAKEDVDKLAGIRHIIQSAMDRAERDKTQAEQESREEVTEQAEPETDVIVDQSPQPIMKRAKKAKPKRKRKTKRRPARIKAGKARPRRIARRKATRRRKPAKEKASRRKSRARSRRRR